MLWALFKQTIFKAGDQKDDNAWLQENKLYFNKKCRKLELY